MRTTVATLLLLVLAAVATGGEARAGDGGSARQLLTNPDPPSCKYPNCNKALKHKCDWLPEAHLECDTGKKYHVPVKNCFEDKVSYVSIDDGYECTEYPYPKPGQYFATLELKCGANITIYGYDKYKLKGDGSKSCKHEGKEDCKTCKYTATYDCGHPGHPGSVCREADGKCDVAEKFDNYCHCPYDRYQNSSYVCRPSKGICDAAEYCSGDSGDCPEDKYASHDTVCRKKAGPCDVAEYCHHGYCPGDKKVPAGKLCRKKYGKCDVADYCDGYSADCIDKVASNTTVCREAKGPCDAEEKCDGSTKKCPEDCCVYKPEKPGPYCPVKYI